MGRGPRLHLARGRAPEPRCRGLLVPLRQRRRSAAGRYPALVLAAPPGLRARRGPPRRCRVRGLLGAVQAGGVPGWRRRRLATGAGAADRSGGRGLGARDGLGVSRPPGRGARRAGPAPVRPVPPERGPPSAPGPSSPPRPVPHHRVPRAVPPLRRVAGAAADLAPGLPPQLLDGRRACARREAGTCPRPVGDPPGNLAAVPRRLSRGGPDGHAFQRAPVLALAHAGRRAALCGRRDGTPGRLVSLHFGEQPRRAESAHCIPRPRRRTAGQRVRKRPRVQAGPTAHRNPFAGSGRTRAGAQGVPAARRRTAQGNRQLLHAAVNHGLPRAADAVPSRQRGGGRVNPQAAGPGSRDGKRGVHRCRVSLPGRGLRGRAGSGWRVPARGRRRRRQAIVPAHGRLAVPLRRGPQPHGGAARAPLAVADDAGPRSPADLPGSSPARRGQSPRGVAGRHRPASRPGRSGAGGSPAWQPPLHGARHGGSRACVAGGAAVESPRRRHERRQRRGRPREGSAARLPVGPVLPAGAVEAGCRRVVRARHRRARGRRSRRDLSPSGGTVR